MTVAINMKSADSMKTLANSLTWLLFLLMTGCGTLPDARPFAGATSTLSASVKSSGQALSDSIRETSNLDPSNKAQYEAIIHKIDDTWAVRVKAAQGAVAYSDAIADLIGAGKESGETVKRVGDSLETLAASINTPLPVLGVGVAADVARFLTDRIAIVRASKTLQEAIMQAQPAVDSIADQLANDTEKQLRPAVESAYKNAISSIKSRYEKEDNFARSFQAKREEVLETLITEANAQNIQKLQVYDHIQASVAATLIERDQQLRQATSTYKTRLQLINALSVATTTWAQTHRDLASAIKEKRKVNVTELLETMNDLKELIRKVRSL